ncbi:uncharacterized protein LOC122850673 [Aphidius gifuensis]|uniref:uncharacterized protein LOC122850673 n=1 Tax=Aphidius gifuensis TaxID=684658 RepID=UPI001CDC9B26|nr:uncharacterized protein LOC122850673 [Aphidius gifuensis]
MSIQTPFVIFIIIILISSTIGQSDDGIIKVSSSDIPTSSQSSLANSVNNTVKSNNTSVATTTDSSLLVSIITEIYNLTLKPIGKFIAFIIKSMAKIMLYPVGKILNGALHLIGIHDIGGKISSLIMNITRIYANYITNIGAIVAAIFDIISESHDEETHKIAKRSIMDIVTSIGHASTLPVRVAEGISSIPYRIMSDILDVLLYPFRAVYRIITWPYRALFGSGDDDDTAGANRNDRSTKTSDNFINNMINNIANNMSNATQAAMATAITKIWQTTKTSILPSVDSFLEQASKSTMLPEFITTNSDRIHKLYRFAHLFGIF